MIEFKLPDIGEGVAEGEIVKWLVAEGDSVKEHQAVVEVMTDKATVEVPAPAAGRITRLIPSAGDTVPVGKVIFHLETGAATAVAKAPAPAAAAPVVTAPAVAPAEPLQAAGGSTIEFKLPDIGEGVAEGEIVRWIVQEGALVAEHQSVVEVMTDKATVEVPAPAAGKITALLAKAGDTVPVGQVIFRMSTGATAPSAAKPAAATIAQAPLQAVTPAAAAERDAKILAVPSARRVARDLQIDLSMVKGSGRNGVVRRADVEAFASMAAAQAVPAKGASAPAGPSSGAGAAAATTIASAAEQRVPFRGVRRKIAEAMVKSKQTAPHFTVVEEIDVTELVRLREKAKDLGAKQGVKVTFMPFIMKAVANGLMKFRMLNGRLDEAAGEIVLPGSVDLGIATDTPTGLIVPVIRGVEQKGLMQIAAELQDLAERTRSGKVRPEELKGSTFSITNAGNIGGTLATPIINFPDIAILGVHRIVKRPGVVETAEGDAIEVRQYMNLSCSVDHRLADGADAARFLAWLRVILEEPGLIAL